MYHVSDVRKRCFSHKSVALWKGLPDDVVAAGSLSTFKAALSRTIHADLYKLYKCRVIINSKHNVPC